MGSPIDNPGSVDAVARGCTCDLIKNNFGRGTARPDGAAFCCSDTCPVHGELQDIKNLDSDIRILPDETKAALKWLQSKIARLRKRGSCLRKRGS
jgi:hypothetical protein